MWREGVQGGRQSEAGAAVQQANVGTPMEHPACTDASLDTPARSLAITAHLRRHLLGRQHGAGPAAPQAGALRGLWIWSAAGLDHPWQAE